MKNKSFQDYAPEKYVTVGKRRFDGVGIKLATKAKATLGVIAKMISNYSGKLFRRHYRPDANIADNNHDHHHQRWQIFFKLAYSKAWKA